MCIRDRYGNRLDGLVGGLRYASQPGLGDPDVLFSTVHKAKGGQWPTVVLWDDFADVSARDHHGIREVPPEDELNLIYVAVTRAQHTLYVNQSIQQAWEQDRGGSRLVLSQAPFEIDGKPMVCGVCCQEFIPRVALCWVRLAQSRSSLEIINEDGRMCMGCAKLMDAQMYTFAEEVFGAD
eukprot:TRINITY_DN26816_c0_g1_i2.p1 TRINITY_DN26816_c0_g1~~TRINITY_DN26816_c0_g1_i2.p1  ORF type:complete len:180 (+),score=27.14 TRINITY_DN26816_c0_g1_i2:132-671(+)